MFKIINEFAKNKKAQLSLTNWPIFMRLTAVESEIREIPRNSLKIQTYGVHGHPRSSIFVPVESPYVTCY